MYKQRNKRRDKIAIEKRIKLCEQVKEKKTRKIVDMHVHEKFYHQIYSPLQALTKNRFNKK